MKRLITVSLLFMGLVASLHAQRYDDPRDYYREFQSQNRRIKIKKERYLEAVLRSEDPRRISKYRELVLEQLNESRRDLKRVGPYKDDKVLHREYMDALDMYIDAFKNNFGKADSLTENRYRSYEDLKKFYEAANTAELEMLDAAYKIEKAEDYFAKTYNVKLRRDKETDEKLEKMDRITVYTRDLTAAFFRVDAQIRNIYKAMENDNQDTLPVVITNLRKAVKTSMKEAKEYGEFEGDDNLLDELTSYLEEVNGTIDEILRPLADKLRNKFLPEDEYEDARKDLKRFKQWHEERVTEFFEAKNELITDYLPED